MLTLILNIISLIFILLGIFLYLFLSMHTKDQFPKLTKKSSPPNFCILIPARDESRVIENLLISLKNQTMTIPFSNVYVIVEEKKDKTVSIVKKYQANILFRTTLSHQRKGYALDEAVQQILPKKYDAYFIFDADNVLDNSYFEQMTKTYLEGYDIGLCYRNCKNGNANVIASCSALTFSMINTLSNQRRQKKNNALTLSGTGFYVTGSLIDKWQGYPFHTLTEDYELTLYTSLHHLSMHYNDKALLFDEQPTTYKVTKTQRTRWIKGYFEARKKYLPLLIQKLKDNPKNKPSILLEIVGIYPIISLLIGFILFLVNQILNYLSKKISILPLILTIIGAYLILLVITIYIIKKENHKLSLTKISQIKAILFNPIYLFSYLPCAIKAFTTKNVTWTKIEHKDNTLSNHQ